MAFEPRPAMNPKVDPYFYFRQYIDPSERELEIVGEVLNIERWKLLPGVTTRSITECNGNWIVAGTVLMSKFESVSLDPNTIRLQIAKNVKSF